MESRSQKLGRPRRKPEEVDDVAELGALADQPGREGPARGGGDLCGNQISGAHAIDAMLSP